MSSDPFFVVAAVAAFFVVNTAAGLAVGYGLERWVRRRIWSVPTDPGQLRHEAVGNVVFVVVAVVVCSAGFFAVRFGDDSAVRVAATVGAFFFAFQAWFWVMHRLLHTKALVRFHRWHHVSRVTTPLSGQSASVVEALLWMVGYAGIPLLLSQVAPLSLVGVAAYLSFNVIGNIMGHANVEVVPPSTSLWWRSTLATVFTYHALHHARWTGHYGYASTWADRLFGSEWQDWPALHEQVWSGRPMQSLKEKL